MRELLIDKSVDFVLIFVGLLAALLVEGWGGKRKEHSDYLAMLESFESEVSHNQKQVQSLEKSIGPISEVRQEECLGGLRQEIRRYRDDFGKAEQMFGCVHTILAAASAPRPTAEQAQQVERCAPILESVETQSRHESHFRPIKLEPVFQGAVSQLCLVSGVGIFEDKELAIKINQLHANVADVERRVAGIEQKYNEELGRNHRDAMMLAAELEDVLPAGDDDDATARRIAAKGPEMQAKLERAPEQMRQGKYFVTGTEYALQNLVIQLKGLMAELDKTFSEAHAHLQSARSKG